MAKRLVKKYRTKRTFKWLKQRLVPMRVQARKVQRGNGAERAGSTGRPKARTLPLAPPLNRNRGRLNGLSAAAADQNLLLAAFGMVTDRFGVPWMVVVKPDQSPS